MQFGTANKTFSVASLHSKRSAGGARKRVSMAGSDLVNFTAQLAIMVRSGVDVATAIESLARQCRKPAFAKVLNEIHEAVIGGRSFSDSLRRYPEVFDSAYVATVAAGEASGHMSEVLEQLAELQRGQLKLMRTIRSLLLYPVLLTSVSLFVISVLLIFVLPQFAELFDQYDTPLPWITTVLIAVAEELRQRWWLWGPLAVLTVIGLIMMVATEKGRRLGDWVLLNAMLLRDVTRTLLIGRICRLIGLMMDNGVPLLDSVQLARRATRSALYQELLADIEDAVINGRTFASAISKSAIVPPSAIEMLATAEQAGKLGEVSRLIGTYFEEESEARTRQLITMLEPMITVVMGGVVAVVVLAVMLPVFDLSTFSGKH